ncbi:hypothetical protein [Streptomyces sp. NPDC101166]|uniref:hypothetical protein n=1 Tax=Streptomyces sp. NPDC101166 TaxID=3366120 RepID=UPI00381109BB
MDLTSLTIPIETARHVLWRYDRAGGTEPGPFTQHLMGAISHADYRNRAILREAYPELSEALRLAHTDEDGIAKLQDIARGGVATEETPAPQCPEALFNPENGALLRCVQQGRHEWHHTPSGTQWRIPVSSGAGDPF